MLVQGGVCAESDGPQSRSEERGRSCCLHDCWGEVIQERNDEREGGPGARGGGYLDKAAG